MRCAKYIDLRRSRRGMNQEKALVDRCRTGPPDLVGAGSYSKRPIDQPLPPQLSALVFFQRSAWVSPLIAVFGARVCVCVCM